MDTKTQLYFKPNGNFEFIKRPLEFSCLVERDKGEIVRGWKHFYNNQIPFRGYKNISADKVILGFSRDIILDPFDKVPVGPGISNKPDAKKPDSLKAWAALMAENARQVYRSKRQSTTKEDLINYCLIGVNFIVAAAWAIRYAIG